MNTSIVHDSGALLLGEDDVRFIDHTFHNPGARPFGDSGGFFGRCAHMLCTLSLISLCCCHRGTLGRGSKPAAVL